MDQPNSPQKVNHQREKGRTTGVAQAKDKRARKSEKWILRFFLKSRIGSPSWQSQKVLRIAILPTESWRWGYWHVSQQNRSNRDRGVLVVWRRQTIHHISIHKVPKMASRRRTPSLEKEPRWSRDTVAKAARKEMVGRTTSRSVCNRTTPRIFEESRSGK